MKIGTTEQILNEIIAHAGKHIVLLIPMGIGKPNRLVNALYRRVKGDASLSLKLVTALSLERPVAHSELEQRFLDPFVERVFGDYPDLDYLKDSRTGSLPSNISVYEFFYKTGDYLGNSPAQQHFIYSNYSHVARDAVTQGVNVMMQAIAIDETSSTPRYSWSSNPDVGLDLVALQKASNAPPIMTVGVVNHKLPFMLNLPLNSPMPLALSDGSQPAPTALTGPAVLPAAVPEPASVAVFAVALGGLGLWGRRRVTGR